MTRLDEEGGQREDGVLLPNALYVRVERIDGSEHDHELKRGAYVWPDRKLVTLYPTDSYDEGVIVPMRRVVYIRYGKREA